MFGTVKYKETLIQRNLTDRISTTSPGSLHSGKRLYRRRTLNKSDERGLGSESGEKRREWYGKWGVGQGRVLGGSK